MSVPNIFMQNKVLESNFEHFLPDTVKTAVQINVCLYQYLT